MDLKRSVLVPYPIHAMFDLIERAEDYPLFLPWCVSTQMLERSDDWVAARIEFKYLHVRFAFQTRNPKRRPEWLSVRLVEGPFRRFEGDWTLTPVGRHGCRVEFALSYEVSDGLLDKVAAKAAELVARSMMDAFVKRAEDTLSLAQPEPEPEAEPAPQPLAVAPPDAAPAVADIADVADVADVAAGGEPEAAAGPLPVPVQADGPPAMPAPLSAPMPTTAPRPDAALPAGLPAVSPPAAPAAAPLIPLPAIETTMTTVDPALLEAVRACPLSQELSAEESAVLAALMRLETYAPHQVVAAEGVTDPRLCVVVDGQLAVIKQVGAPDEALLVSLNPGDFAHELGFLDGAARYASLVAVSTSHVLTLERQALETLITTHPMILYRVMCAIVRTVHRVQTRLSVQTSELTNYIVKQHGRY